MLTVDRARNLAEKCDELGRMIGNIFCEPFGHVAANFLPGTWSEIAEALHAYANTRRDPMAHPFKTNKAAEAFDCANAKTRP